MNSDLSRSVCSSSSWKYYFLRCANLLDDCQSWNLKLVLGHSTSCKLFQTVLTLSVAMMFDMRNLEAVLMKQSVMTKWLSNFIYNICTYIYILSSIKASTPPESSWIFMDVMWGYSATSRWIVPLNDRPFRQLLSSLHNLRKAASYQPHQVCLGQNGWDLSQVGL